MTSSAQLLLSTEGMKPYLPSIAALSLLTVVPLVEAKEAADIPAPIEWAPQAGPPSSCGRALWIGAAMPWPERGEDGEWLDLVNPSPIPVSVKDWELVVGRRRRRLPNALVAPGGTLRLDAAWLGTLHLRNQDGHATLVDPCGREAERAEWAETARGLAMWRAKDADSLSRLE